MIEKSYVMIKPGFAGNTQIIDYVKQRIENINLNINFESYVRYDDKHARIHCAEHSEKPFFEDLVKYFTSDESYGMEVEGENAISQIRSIIGSAKHPEEGSIRREAFDMLGIDFDIRKNVVHASDSSEAAQNELNNFYDLVQNNINYMDNLNENSQEF